MHFHNTSTQQHVLHTPTIWRCAKGLSIRNLAEDSEQAMDGIARKHSGLGLHREMWSEAGLRLGRVGSHVMPVVVPL